MPPSLALFLCCLVVLFLLRLDRKEEPNISWTSWIPTLWILIISSKSVGSWMGLEADDDGSLWDRVVLSGMIGAGLFLLAVRKFKLSDQLRENVWLCILIIYMFVSILWSDIAYIAFKRWIREFGSVIMALVLVTEPNPRLAVQSVLRRSTYILIPVSILLIKYFPQYGVGYGRWLGDLVWYGVCVSKNGLGRVCLVAIMFLAWTLIVRWWRQESPSSRFQSPADFVVLLIALWILKGPPGAYPATAVGALIIGLASFLVLLLMEKWRMILSRSVVMLVVAGIMVIGYLTPILGGATVGSFSSVLGRNENLTGRTDLWVKLLPLYEQNSILGYGFGSFWTPAMEEANYGVREAHNGYLDVCLGLGLIGLALTAMFLLSFSSRAVRSMAYDYEWSSLCLCFLLITLLHNITESSIDSFGKQLMTILLFLSVCLPKRQKYWSGSPHRKVATMRGKRFIPPVRA